MNITLYKTKKMVAGILASGGLLLGNLSALAQDAVTSAATTAATVAVASPVAPTTIDTGDTGWVLVCTALVLLMTIPGLAFFYGGLVRKKNVLSVLMQCFVITCLISIQWVLFGYSLAFGPDVHGFIGNLDWAGLKNVSAALPHWNEALGSSYAGTIPHQAFMIFQMMFAVITPALIIGAFAERFKFSALCVFSILWATLVYDPVAHWVWGKGGFLGGMGALDFAGGTVVHVNAGVAALVCALVLGKRIGYPNKTSPPHNLPFAVLGAALLWFGWYGFNAGSALGAGSLATSALVTTHVATAAAGLTWILMDYLFNRHATVLGVITGAVGGLVAITPAAGFVTPAGAIAIGIGAGFIPYLFVTFIKPKFGYDDTLDAFGVHGVGGIWGALATGLFCTKAVNSAGTDGLFYGGGIGQFITQCKAVGVTIVFAFIGTWLLLKLVDKVIGLRVSAQGEKVGLDLTDHRETGYTMLE